MANRAEVMRRFPTQVPEIRSAHTGEGDANHRVGWVLNDRVRSLTDGNGPWSAVERRFHSAPSPSSTMDAPYSSSVTCSPQVALLP
jgi:hypothetical protein